MIVPALGVLQNSTFDRLMGQTCTDKNRTTRKVKPSPQLVTEEKFIFQKAILILKHNIQLLLVKFIDQVPLSYVSQEKCTLRFKGAKNKPIWVVDDKADDRNFCSYSFLRQSSFCTLIKLKCKTSAQINSICQQLWIPSKVGITIS